MQKKMCGYLVFILGTYIPKWIPGPQNENARKAKTFILRNVQSVKMFTMRKRSQYENVHNMKMFRNENVHKTSHEKWNVIKSGYLAFIWYLRFPNEFRTHKTKMSNAKTVREFWCVWKHMVTHETDDKQMIWKLQPHKIHESIIE